MLVYLYMHHNFSAVKLQSRPFFLAEYKGTFDDSTISSRSRQRVVCRKSMHTFYSPWTRSRKHKRVSWMRYLCARTEAFIEITLFAFDVTDKLDICKRNINWLFIVMYFQVPSVPTVPRLVEILATERLYFGQVGRLETTERKILWETHVDCCSDATGKTMKDFA